jgi:hypothetical protein
MYRPKDFCQMRSLGADFCEVCRQQYVLTLYQGGWGEPVAGIDLIEPGFESPAPGSFNSSAAVNFSIRYLEPTSGVSISWTVNGQVQAGETSGSFQLNADFPSLYTVVVKVTDTGSFVHPAVKPAGVMSSQRTWVVTIEPSGNDKIFENGFET